MGNRDSSYVRIDGSFGEGGGQILRTAISLSTHLRVPVEIVNIRKNRKYPGLMPQHLTAVKACQAICNGKVEGAEINSERLFFRPNKAKAGKYSFNVAEHKRSAGSATLVFQTVLLPLLFVRGESHITIQGGTHVPWSPPASYIRQVFLPVLERLGCQTFFKIKRWGWYPEGGGEIYCHIKSLPKLTPYQFHQRGKLKRIYGLSVASNIGNNVANRQMKAALKALRNLKLRGDIQIKDVAAAGKGTILFLTAEFERVRAGFSTLGERGIPAEKVAHRTVEDLNNFLGKSVCLDNYLADQLIPYIALCGERVEMNVSRITTHLLTNLWVVKKFLPIDYELKGPHDLPGTLVIKPAEIPKPEEAKAPGAE
ncbi:MAG: RNA 3'-phosphate cyclase [candidate division Zixibacteria bacterium]|nr:RNA 3'-phosphate cyclase [candidate division Zixibacteria bacterium]